MAASAKIMRLPGNEIYRRAATGVKMGLIGLAINVKSSQHAFVIARPFKNQLAVGEHYIAVSAVAQRRAGFMGGG